MAADGPGTWQARAETLEAIIALAAARLLIDWIPFGRWRGRLGRLVPADSPKRSSDTVAPDEAHRLARVVERGVRRAPFTARCLPQAMALGAMLRRRGLDPVIVLAALPGHARGGIDDLHAWVELGGEILIGESVLPYLPLARFA